MAFAAEYVALGKLEINFGDIEAEGLHELTPEGKSVITINRKFAGDLSPEDEIAHKLTLFHELSHARSRQLMDLRLVKDLEVRAPELSEEDLFHLETTAGFRQLMEEFGAYMDQISIELAMRGPRATRVSAMLGDFQSCGESIIIDFLEKKYSKQIVKPWKAWIERNPWWFD